MEKMSVDGSDIGTPAMKRAVNKLLIDKSKCNIQDTEITKKS